MQSVGKMKCKINILWIVLQSRSSADEILKSLGITRISLPHYTFNFERSEVNLCTNKVTQKIKKYYDATEYLGKQV